MTERVLLVGGGGREHAIARAMASDDRAAVYAAASNRNPGIDALATGYETLDPADPEAVVEYAREIGATLAVIGPEGPLAAGVADALNDAGVFAFGPERASARIETDKAFQRRFMRENDIPGCPDFETFTDSGAAADYLAAVEGDVAVKPTGLTGGKGVRVTGEQLTLSEAVEYVKSSEHDEWVIEERLVGEEFTVQAFVADGAIRATPAVQDHKRAYEDDTGPNTGGMGSYAGAGRCLPFMTEADYRRAVEILRATIDALDGYTGVLYGQFMLTASGPKVVEFNARFGDPEAMNTLPVMETDLLDVLLAARAGDPLPDVDFAPRATVCRYAVPKGYPSDPEAGARLPAEPTGAEDALMFYASVDARPDGVYTTTSRSFAIVGQGDSIAAAEEVVTAAFEGIDTSGLRVRSDIGTDASITRRIEHMRGLRAGKDASNG